MQNTFPYLLSWGLLSPFILRLVAGYYFAMIGYLGLTTEWWERYDFFDRHKIHPAKLFATATAAMELAGGVMLIMGLFTQIVSIALAIVCITALIVKKQGEKFPPRDANVYTILFFILASLFISGAGFYAMDLPI